MKQLVSLLIQIIFLTVIFVSNAHAGPVVVPHAKSNNKVQIVDYTTGVEFEFSDVAQIHMFQQMFVRAKKIGDTISHLKTPTHKIRFSNTWLIDLKNGEIGMLRKQVGDVYLLESEDLKTLIKVIQTSHDNMPKTSQSPNK